MSVKTKNVVMKDKIDYAVFKDANISEETIGKWMKNDIECAYILISEIMHDADMQKALLKIFWERYQRLHATAQIQESIQTQQAAYNAAEDFSNGPE